MKRNILRFDTKLPNEWKRSRNLFFNIWNRRMSHYHESRSSVELDTYAWNVVSVANVFSQQSISNFPGEYWRTFPLVQGYAIYHVVGSYSRFAAANRPRSDCTAFIVTTENLANASVRYLQQWTTKRSISNDEFHTSLHQCQTVLHGHRRQIWLCRISY